MSVESNSEFVDGFEGLGEEYDSTCTEQYLKLDALYQRSGLTSHLERVRYLRICGWNVNRAVEMISQDRRRRESW